MKRIFSLVMIVVISTLFHLSTAGTVAASGAGGYWVWENPTPTGNHLCDVASLDEDHAWAVGAGLICRSPEITMAMGPATSLISGKMAAPGTSGV